MLILPSVFAQEISIEQPAGTPLENSRVIAWGDNSSGKTTVPAGLAAVQAIAAGGFHSLALKRKFPPWHMNKS